MRNVCVCVGVCVYKTTTTQVFPPLPPRASEKKKKSPRMCVTEVSEKAACERKNGLPLPSRPPPSSLSCGCVDAMNKKKAVWVWRVCIIIKQSFTYNTAFVLWNCVYIVLCFN